MLVKKYNDDLCYRLQYNSPQFRGSAQVSGLISRQLQAWGDYFVPPHCTVYKTSEMSGPLTNQLYRHQTLSFSFSWPVNRLCGPVAFCLTDCIDWRYIQSWFVFSNKLVNCCTMDEGTIWYLCTVAPLLYLLSDLPPLPPSQCTVYTDSVWWWGGGGVEMYCGPYSAGVLHSVSDQIQNLQNCFTTPNNNDQ